MDRIINGNTSLDIMTEGARQTQEGKKTLINHRMRL